MNRDESWKTAETVDLDPSGLKHEITGYGIDLAVAALMLASAVSFVAVVVLLLRAAFSLLHGLFQLFR